MGPTVPKKIADHRKLKDSATTGDAKCGDTGLILVVHVIVYSGKTKAGSKEHILPGEDPVIANLHSGLDGANLPADARKEEKKGSPTSAKILNLLSGEP